MLTVTKRCVIHIHTIRTCITDTVTRRQTRKRNATIAESCLADSSRFRQRLLSDTRLRASLYRAPRRALILFKVIHSCWNEGGWRPQERHAEYHQQRRTAG